MQPISTTNLHLLTSKALAEDISLIEEAHGLLRQAQRQNRPALAYMARFECGEPHTEAAAQALKEGTPQAMLDARNTLLAAINSRTH